MTRTEFIQRYYHLRSVKQAPDYPLTYEGRAASVLIPLVEHHDELRVILTQRALHLKHHPGQISFPGGGVEDSDLSMFDTALRETHEEIGIPPSYIEPIGSLSRYRTISGYSIEPVVGFVQPNYPLIIDTNEVDSVFEVPLEFLMDRTNYLAHYISRKGEQHAVYFIPWQNRLIWGATAALLRNLSYHLSP